MAKAKPKRGATPTRVYQIKVTLEGAKPPIWRRLLVSADMTLADVHDIIQVAMGWHNCHLHMFEVNGESYGQPHPDDFEDIHNEARITLGKVAPGEKAKIHYQYDFGDSWDHSILVEKVLEPDPAAQYPSCVKGVRNCPPEDCGGIWGYADFLAAIADPKHPEHADMVEWSGGGFDPEEFDLAAVNATLRRFR